MEFRLVARLRKAVRLAWQRPFPQATHCLLPPRPHIPPPPREGRILPAHIVVLHARLSSTLPPFGRREFVCLVQVEKAPHCSFPSSCRYRYMRRGQVEGLKGNSCLCLVFRGEKGLSWNACHACLRIGNRARHHHGEAAACPAPPPPMPARGWKGEASTTHCHPLPPTHQPHCHCPKMAMPNAKMQWPCLCLGLVG